MMKRKATPKPKPSPRSSSSNPARTDSNRLRSQSVASRRPTPVSSHGGGGSREPKASAAATDEEIENLYRVRSFTTRTGVVVNRGDSFKRRGQRSDARQGSSDDPLPGPQSGRIHPPPASSDPFPGPQSGRIHPPPASSDPFPGPQSGRIHPPPASSVSFASHHQQQSGDDSEPIPLGAGHIVHQFTADHREEFSVPPPGSSSGFDDPTEPPPPPPPLRSRQSLAAASGGSVGRRGRRPSSAGDAGAEDSSAPPVYKVLVLGSQGVGKKTLTKQLLSSEYYSSDGNNAEERDDETVTVQLDDEESVIQFIDAPGFEIGKSGPSGSSTAAAENRFDVRQGSRDFGKMSYAGDGFLVVYSVTDRGSFRFAQSCLQELRPAKRHNAVILVANKHDLVRNRIVPETEGIKLATKRHCKFIEVSSLLDHRMDDLLVGIVRQIRLRQRRSSLRPDGPMTFEGKGTGSRLTHTIGNFFQKIFKKDRETTGKCEDLMAP